MKHVCDECNGKLTIDLARAEGVCDNCSLVHNLPTLDADSNSSSSFGEEAHVGKVDEDGKAGTKMDLRNQKDGKGAPLSARNKKIFDRISRIDRNTQRRKDPMFYQLMLKMREIFGENLAHATRFLAEATARKLTPKQEEKRKALKSTSMRNRLACPKTSLTRREEGIKGESEEQMLAIMALAIASLSAKWFGTVPINEKRIMDQYGISKAQLTAAKNTIAKHYKARVSMGWALAPRTVMLAANRSSDFEAALENLDDALTGRLTIDELEMVFDAFKDAMNALEEPSMDGPMANVSIQMVAACVLYEVMSQLGLNEGHLNAIANAVGLSGAGVKNRLQNMKELHDEGLLKGGDAVFKVKSTNRKHISSGDEEEAAED